MSEQHDQDDQSNRRAVSPVIGVILMVAITVILAAVIGAFVLEIGDQQETAPNTSFDSEESVRYFSDGPSNLTTVSVAHAGGSVLDERQIQVSVNGNSSTYDLDETGGTAIPLPAGELGGNPIAAEDGGCPPQATCELSSGQAWRVVVYGIDHDVFHSPASGSNWNTGWGMNLDNHAGEGPFPCCGPPGDVPHGKVLDTDDTVRVVWSASSGGKTQTLFQYSVQSGSPDLPYAV